MGCVRAMPPAAFVVPVATGDQYVGAVTATWRTILDRLVRTSSHGYPVGGFQPTLYLCGWYQAFYTSAVSIREK